MLVLSCRTMAGRSLPVREGSDSSPVASHTKTGSCGWDFLLTVVETARLPEGPGKLCAKSSNRVKKGAGIPWS